MLIAGSLIAVCFVGAFVALYLSEYREAYLFYIYSRYPTVYFMFLNMVFEFGLWFRITFVELFSNSWLSMKDLFFSTLETISLSNNLKDYINFYLENSSNSKYYILRFIIYNIDDNGLPLVCNPVIFCEIDAFLYIEFLQEYPNYLNFIELQPTKLINGKFIGDLNVMNLNPAYQIYIENWEDVQRFKAFVFDNINNRGSVNGKYGISVYLLECFFEDEGLKVCSIDILPFLEGAGNYILSGIVELNETNLHKFGISSLKDVIVSEWPSAQNLLEVWKFFIFFKVLAGHIKLQILEFVQEFYFA